MAEKSYDEEVVREVIKKSKPELLRRLPIDTLPLELEYHEVISDEERALIASGVVSVQKREKLVDILLTKDGSAILKALEILRNRERGYVELVDRLYANMDDMQKVTSKKPLEVSVSTNGVQRVEPAPEVAEADTSMGQPLERFGSMDTTLTENQDMLKHTMDSCPSLEQMLPSLHSMYEKVMVVNTFLKEQATLYKLDLEKERTEQKEEMGRFENRMQKFHADVLALTKKQSIQHLERDEPVTQVQQPKEAEGANWNVSIVQPQEKFESMESTLTENSDMLKHTMDSCPSLEQMLPSLHSMYEKVMVENTSLKEQVRENEDKLERLTRKHIVIERELANKCEEAKNYEGLFFTAEAKRYEAVRLINEVMKDGVEVTSESGRETYRRVQETLKKEALEAMFQVFLQDFQREKAALEEENRMLRCELQANGIDDQMIGHSESLLNDPHNSPWVAEDKEATPGKQTFDATKVPAVASPNSPLATTSKPPAVTGIASRPKPVAAPRQNFNMPSTPKPPVGTTQKASGAVVAIPKAAPNDLPGESRPAEKAFTFHEYDDRQGMESEQSSIVKTHEQDNVVNVAKPPPVIPRKAPAPRCAVTKRSDPEEELPRCDVCGEVFPWNKVHLRWKHKCYPSELTHDTDQPRQRSKSSAADFDSKRTAPSTLSEELSSSLKLNEQYFQRETDSAPKQCRCGRVFHPGREFITHVLTCSGSGSSIVSPTAARSRAPHSSLPQK